MIQKKSRIQKGDFGYLAHMRKKMTIQTIIFFGLSLAIFCIGYWYTKTQKNLLTVVAILGMLPASKSAVSMILYYKAQLCSTSIYEQTTRVCGKLPMLYELVLTSYDRNFPLSSVCVYQNQVVGFSENATCDVNAAAKHISSYLKQNALPHDSVKIFSEFNIYARHLEQLQQLQNTEVRTEDMEEKDCYMLALIKQISI